ADLCALAALIRPKGGAAEWSVLRPPLVQRDRVTLLGLLWAMAADSVSEAAGLAPEARFAPLSDLLLSSQPAPPGFHLAGTLLLRTVPDRQAWLALEALGDEAGDPANFLAATRWLHRPGAEEGAWFADRLRAMPAQRRAILRDAILTSVAPPSQAGAQAASAPVELVVAAMRRSPTVAQANALAIAHALAPAEVQATVEREGLLETLQDNVTGRARRLQRGSAQRLQAQLLGGAGWAAAWEALSAEPAVPPGSQPLAATHDGRFGRLQLPPGSMVRLEAPRDAGSVTLLHATTHRSRQLRPGESWYVRAREDSGAGDWLFRLDGEAAGLRLVSTLPAPLVLAREDSTRLPLVEPGRLYRVDSMAPEAEGWARLEVARGDRLRIATLGLARGVDTVVALVREDDVLADDDDGGEGLESLLNWTADAPGEIRLRLQNIGRGSGGFELMVTRLP
ncbi:hypothetical protein, partial [Falsiroseomonas oryzae]|uniref:hypothetical protein n=1 Tax=Falsiroseomonas oryzae TaxID=2766473 RepID=UPI0022EB6B70